MKVLLVSASPLERAGEQWFAVDTWIRFPRSLASRVDRVTVYAPVRDLAGRSASARSWLFEPGPMRIHAHECFASYLEYYRLWPTHRKAWRQEIESLVREHDAVLLRLPDPRALWIAKQVKSQGKKLVCFVAGDVMTQSDRLLSARGLLRVGMSIVARRILRQEIRACRRATLVYAYSKELAVRHGLDDRVRSMRTPHLAVSDFVQRDDSCQSDPIRILRVAWLVPSKGIEYLIDAIAILLAHGRSVVLEVVGDERVPGFRTRLERHARARGVADHVVFSGWVAFDRLADRYLAADIHVISSLSEGTPRCIGEGAARGLPLIATTVGGCPDILTHEENALLVPPGNAEAIATSIERIIDDSALRSRLISNGYSLAREGTFEALGQRVVADLDRITGRTSVPE